VPYTAPTPSTVSPGDTFPATAYNIIAGDIADHESRIKTGVESYTTAQKTALTGVSTGTVIYDSTLATVQVWNGSAWVNPNKPPMVEVRRATGYSYTSASLIQWSAVDWDTDGMWDAASPTILTIRTAGIYSVSFNCKISASATVTSCEGIVRKNGVNNHISYGAIVSGSEMFFSMTGNISLAVNDTLSAIIVLTGGSNYNINGGAADSQNRSRLSATYIGRTT
jgi:hypothetical protein